MAVSEQQLIAARRKYKNRKKTIRQSYQSGAIDAAERQRRQDEAAIDYYTSTGRQPSWHHLEQKERAAKAGSYLASSQPKAKAAKTAVQQGTCNEECVGATGLICRCGCKGVNHGAANGIEPWMVSVEGMTISERIDAGLLDARDVAEQRLKEAGMR